MKQQIKLNEVVFLIYFLVMFGAKSIGLFEGMVLYNLSLVLGMFLFCLKITMTKHTYLEFVAILFLMGISAIVYLNSGEKGLLLYFTLMLGMKNVSLERLEKWALTILGICFTVLIFISVTGIKQDIQYEADRRLFGTVMRRCLGYPFFNTMFTTYIILLMLIILATRYQKKKTLWVLSALMGIGALYFYLYTCSNTGIIVAFLFVIVNIYLQSKKKIGKIEKVAIELLYPLCFLVTALAPIVLQGDVLVRADQFFHNRIAYARYYWLNEPLTLLGTRFKPAPDANYQIDSSYLYSILQIGIIPCIIVTALMMAMIHHYVKENKRVELAVIVSLCVLGVSDPFFFNLSFKNLMFLFVGELFYQWLDTCSMKFPAFWKREICILKIGEKSFDYQDKGGYKLWSKAAEFLNNTVELNGVKHLVILILTAGIVAVITYWGTDSSVIVGRVDTIPEWEYVRAIISTGIWLAIVVVLVATGIDIHRAKNKNMVG